MNNEIDYISLMDIAKLNLNNCINNAIKNYEIKKDVETRRKLVHLIYDRKKIFLLNKETIKKYL